MYAHRGFFFLESLSLIDCCVQECSFYFSYFNSKLDGRVISNGSSLQSRGVLLNDRHIPRERLTPCLLFLRIPLSRTLKKTNKTKQNKTKTPVLQAIFLVHQSTATRYLFNALFQSTVTPTLISQLLL